MSADTAVVVKTEEPKSPIAAPKATAGPLVAMGEKGIALRNLEELRAFSQMIVASGLAPDWALAAVSDRDNAEQVIRKASAAVAIATQAGLEHGLGPLGGLQAFIVIKGRLSWYGRAAVAKIQNSGLVVPGSLRFWTEGEGTARKGVCVAHRVGYAQADRREFTWKMANDAGLTTKDPWKKYPERMYAWRAVAWLTQEVFPDVLGGFPLAEDVMDYDRRVVRTESRAIPPPPPSEGDPLMETLGILAKPRAGAMDASVTTIEAALETPKEMTHAEADRQIAEEEARQAGLFDRK